MDKPNLNKGISDACIQFLFHFNAQNKSIMKTIRFLAFFILFSIIGSQLLLAQVKPVFENGEAQILPQLKDSSLWIRHDLWVETEFDTDGDGKLDRMHVGVTRPKQTETEGLKLPVIYASSPYYAGTADDLPGLFWDVKHELGANAPPRTHVEVQRTGKRPVISNDEIMLWVPRGYIVVHSSSPGTGLSQGSPTVGGENESLAPKAVIEWLTGKDNGYTSADGNEKVTAFWSTGKVGMTGTSYNGTLPLAAATTGVKGLEAIIPIAPNTPYNNKTVRDTEMAQGMDRATGDYNDFWAGRDYLNQMESMSAALLMSHGFNDWNVMPEHSYRIYNAARAKGIPSMIYYHQYGHGGPPPFSMMNRWFTRYLHGVENDVEKEPRAWIVREQDDRSKPTAYADFPNPEASSVSFFLKGAAPAAGSLVLEKDNTGEKETLVDNYSFSGSALAQADYTEHRLIYLSPVLKEAVHISGIPRITVKLASSKPAANLSVWLVSLPWREGRNTKITDNIITRGWADPQNHASLRESEPLKPGKFYEISFDLQPDDQIIPAGQQIGLMIFSSDKEYTILPKPGTELTIDLNGTVLTLPIVGGKDALEKAVK